MSFFTQTYPKIPYDPTGNKIFTLVQDILTRVIVRKEVSDRKVLFSKYTVRDTDTPESLAVELYVSAKHTWVLLMLNKYYDRYYEWPMTQRDLHKYILDKYSNPDAINHYEISQESGDTQIKIKVELADHPTATPITNYEYETNLNDARKEIRILKRQYLQTFITDYNELIGDNTTWVLKDDVWVAQ